MSSGTLNRAALRQSGELTLGAIAVARDLAAPGVTTRQLDERVEAWIREHRGVPAFLGHRGFPASICTSVNEAVVHGLPGDQPLADGDLVSIDVGVKYDGWYTDSAVTLPIGDVTGEAKRLLAITREALQVALRQARDGRQTGDLGAAVQRYVEDAGFGVVRDCVGHGIGRELHGEPSIPNFGKPGTGTTFRAGMAVAIEPMVTAGDPEIVLGDDKWTLRTRDRSLAAHFEETVIITDGDPERLTPLQRVLPGEQAGARVGRVT